MLLLLISQRKKMSPQHPTFQQFCSDTSTYKNSLECFEKQASLGENVDVKIVQILDDLLNLFEGSEKTSQGIMEQESFQYIHTTCKSRLTG